MVHFVVNHLIVGLALLKVNFAIHSLFGWMENGVVRGFVQSIYFIPQLLLCILVADLVQYWMHRAHHEIPFLWRFYAVHHSAKTMDWLDYASTFANYWSHAWAFSVRCMCWALRKMSWKVVVGFQAVFNHANLHLSWGPLK